MTLILTVANKSGIYQSSDFRLTNPNNGKIVSSRLGSKQLTASFKTFAFHLAFTGVAASSGRNTITQFRDVLKSRPHDNSFEEVIDAVRQSCHRIARGKYSALEVVLAIAPLKGKLRITVISNINKNGEARLAFTRKDHVLYKPSVVLAGNTTCVHRFERRRLMGAAKSSNEKEIWEVLRSVNAMAAGRSNGSISAECWTGSLKQRDGRVDTSGSNLESVPGIMPSVSAEFDIMAFVRDHFKTADGKELTIVQSASAIVSPESLAPSPPPTGERRTVNVTWGRVGFKFKSNAGNGLFEMEILPSHRTSEIFLNVPLIVPLFDFRIQVLYPGSNGETHPRFPWPEFEVPIHIDGSKSLGVRFHLGCWFEADASVVQVLATTQSLANPSWLRESEELLITAPSPFQYPTRILAGQPVAIPIGAQIFWRDKLHV